MGMLGNYRRLCLDAEFDFDKEKEVLFSLISSNNDENYLCIGKAWHVIHFLLTGSDSNEGSPLSKVIFSENSQLLRQSEGSPFDCSVSMLTPNEVKEILNNLNQVSLDEIKSRFDNNKLLSMGIYPEFWWRQDNEPLEYILSSYCKIISFFEKSFLEDQFIFFYIL